MASIWDALNVFGKDRLLGEQVTPELRMQQA